eukprot:CAMPEP_0170412262 /NCGR_PEP_ID=MMETSP0117_2-20130122/30875_1 /TAXON_ID=400756 /ORGANISM="Durinskia baltica, Strain CSIRO CS-38" /LENGTH=94 /DNA_ID=CAMNT_0010669941 /DNA_START=66 /DNA_END=347 /DNA_ORIENTATION=-
MGIAASLRCPGEPPERFKVLRHVVASCRRGSSAALCRIASAPRPPAAALSTPKPGKHANFALQGRCMHAGGQHGGIAKPADVGLFAYGRAARKK